MAVSRPFEHLPCGARSHFRLHYASAVYWLIHYLYHLGQDGGPDPRQTLSTYPFLARYFQDALRFMPDAVSWEDGLCWWTDEIGAWEEAVTDHLPLRALSQSSGLSFVERMALLLVGLVEEDSRFGTLIASLQEPLAQRRPSRELIEQILVSAERRADRSAPSIPGIASSAPGQGQRERGALGRTPAEKAPATGSAPERLLGAGLIEALNRDAPRAEWVLRVPALLWDVLRGEARPSVAPWLQAYPPDAFPTTSQLVLPEALRRRVEQLPALIQAGTVAAIVLRGMQGSERLPVIGAVARELGLGLAVVDLAHAREGEPAWSVLGPLCTASRRLPVVGYDLSPGETAELPTLVGYRGPLGVLMGSEGGLSGPAADRAVTLVLPAPTAPQRARHWQAALDGHPVDNLAEVSERFHLPGEYIRQAGALAIAYAALDRRPAVSLADVQEACRSLNRQHLDTLAARLTAEGTWSHLVVDEATALKLRELAQRCRHRERLLDHLGSAFGTARNRGVRALFTGASGTGKTLAARILAAELGLDLYRVDLGAVVNKYIGETEKNLHRVLSRAEELDVLLLLDEGDALLGNRTEVKSSNDRYANLETNYLLQRLESYQGIVVITTNAGQYIDSAFQRRMDVVVTFVPPRAPERLLIWQLHLPANHQIDAECLDDVARRCVLTGGQIRNAALHATLLALDDGGQAVRREHLDAAIQSEYRKAGALGPRGEVGVAAGPRGFDAFVAALQQEAPI